MVDNANGDIIIYQTEDGLTKIDVKIQNETVWLSQQQMAELFGTSRTNVIEHINNIYLEEELDKNSTCQNFRQVRKEGNFSGDLPIMSDVVIAKNYLTEEELKILNNLVSGYFDFAEIQAIRHNPMHMEDYIRQLDTILSSTGEQLLVGAGTISHNKAIEKAKTEYKKYQVKTISPVEKEYLESLKRLNSMVNEKEKKNGEY